MNTTSKPKQPLRAPAPRLLLSALPFGRVPVGAPCQLLDGSRVVRQEEEVSDHGFRWNAVELCGAERRWVEYSTVSALLTIETAAADLEPVVTYGELRPGDWFYVLDHDDDTLQLKTEGYHVDLDGEFTGEDAPSMRVRRAAIVPVACQPPATHVNWDEDGHRIVRVDDGWMEVNDDDDLLAIVCQAVAALSSEEVSRTFVRRSDTVAPESRAAPAAEPSKWSPCWNCDTVEKSRADGWRTTKCERCGFSPWEALRALQDSRLLPDASNSTALAVVTENLKLQDENQRLRETVARLSAQRVQLQEQVDAMFDEAAEQHQSDTQ